MLIGSEVRIRVEIAAWLMTRETAAQGGEVSKSDQVVPIRTSCHT